MERDKRSILPRFQRGYDVTRVENVGRLEGKLPPLMDDVRATHLVKFHPSDSDINIYLKAVGSPYTGEHGIHFLTIPDRVNGENIPGITNLSSTELQNTLQFAGAFAKQVLEQPNIAEVDFGLHHSRAELKGIPKQRIATFPLNLHIHITGYTAEDMEPLSLDEIINSDEITGKTGEALYALGEQLFFHEVVAKLQQDNPAFNDLFQEVKDKRGRRRFKLTRGIKSFEDPKLADILQQIDRMGKEVYDEIAKCFFEYDDENRRFVEKSDQYARFVLIHRAVREERIKRYIGHRSWLSTGVKTGLEILASYAKDENEILQRELSNERKAKGTDLTEEEASLATKRSADRFWAYKDFSYTMVFSAKKNDDGETEWIFAFDPKIFTVEGIVQSSAFTDKLIIKGNGFRTPEELSQIQERERKAIGEVLKNEPDYKFGPGISANI